VHASDERGAGDGPGWVQAPYKQGGREACTGWYIPRVPWWDIARKRDTWPTVKREKEQRGGHYWPTVKREKRREESIRQLLANSETGTGRLSGAASLWIERASLSLSHPGIYHPVYTLRDTPTYTPWVHPERYTSLHTWVYPPWYTLGGMYTPYTPRTHTQGGMYPPYTPREAYTPCGIPGFGGYTPCGIPGFGRKEAPESLPTEVIPCRKTPESGHFPPS